MAGGLEQIPTEQEIESGDFAFRVLEFLKKDYLVEEWPYEALNQCDRLLLIPWIKLATRNVKATKEEMSRLLSLGKPSVLKNSAKQLTDIFTFHRGPRPKLPVRQYAEILETQRTLRQWTFDCQSCASGNSFEHMIKFTYRLEGDDAPYDDTRVIMNLPDEVTIIARPPVCGHCPPSQKKR